MKYSKKFRMLSQRFKRLLILNQVGCQLTCKIVPGHKIVKITIMTIFQLYPKR